jgi:hypothetical protein
MPALEARDPALARFVRELEAQAPVEIGDLRPDLSRASPEDREAAQIVWANRVLGEYRGVIVFTELLAALAEAAAPNEALCAVQRVLGDELRHVRLCTTVVDWLGGWEVLELDLAGQRMERSTDPAPARALEICARELSLVESESVLLLRAHLRPQLDPAIRRVLELLLADEARHAAAGRAIEALLEATYDEAVLAPAKARLAARLDEERAHLRALARARAVGGPGRALGAGLRAEDFDGLL